MKKNYWNLLKTEPDSSLVLSNADWMNLAPYLNDHRLEGFIYKHYAAVMPEALKKMLAPHWQAQWLRNHLYLEELRLIQHLADKFKVNLTVLKGAALIPEFYPDLGSRQMSDLDLLIPMDEFDRFKEMLSSQGYIEKQSDTWKANDFKATFLIHRQSFELVIELHSRLFFTESPNRKWQVTQQSPKSLAPTETLIHLVGHFSYQHTFLKLFWLIDIDRFIRRHSANIDWVQFAQASDQLRMNKAMTATLWVAHYFLDTPIPKSMQKRSFIQKIFLTEKFLWNKKFNLTYYILKNDLKDSFKDTANYSSLWAVQKIKKIFIKSLNT